ncbi:MAG: serine hydrolase, partial [Ferruginibacter sp.]
ETTRKLIPGVTLKGHSGGAYGLSSMMYFQPRKKFGIVAITNGSSIINNKDFYLPIKAILNILYEEVIE